jgi:hypothetical protein
MTDSLWWLVGALAVVLVGVKVAVVMAFRRLATASEESGG